MRSALKPQRTHLRAPRIRRVAPTPSCAAVAARPPHPASLALQRTPGVDRSRCDLPHVGAGRITHRLAHGQPTRPASDL
jgi:hypothetical protein